MLLSNVKIKDLNLIYVPIHQPLCTINYFYSCIVFNKLYYSPRIKHH